MEEREGESAICLMTCKMFNRMLTAAKCFGNVGWNLSFLLEKVSTVNSFDISGQHRNRNVLSFQLIELNLFSKESIRNFQAFMIFSFSIRVV